MFGVVTRNVEELTWSEFDLGFFEVKEVTGRRTDPVAGGVNMVSCFGDSTAIEERPELAARDADGEPATRDRPYFDWGTVCASRSDYREDLLDLVSRCAAVNPALRLDDVGFPRDGYCHCQVCETRFANSRYDDWHDWRAHVVTEFVRTAAERIPGRTYLTVYPDPFPGHLFRRTGIDLEALSSAVDEVVVPIYDMAYATTYWLEALVTGFRDRLDGPFSVELYAVEVDVRALARAASVAEAYADNVIFAYDASNGREAIHELRSGD